MWLGWKHVRRRGLRGWVLTILSLAPKNGAEIMDQIEGMSQGWWRPSPGSIYPLLDEMVREGLVRKREDGRYEVTEKARSESEWPFGAHAAGPRTIEDMLNEIGGYVSYFEDTLKSKRERLEPHLDRIRTIAERLSALVRR